MRLTLTLTGSAALGLLSLGGCDLDDKSLGDTGADETVGSETETEGTDPSGPPDTSDPSDPTSDPSDTADPTSDPSGPGCTEIGCTDGFFLTLTSDQPFADGTYQVQLSEGAAPLLSCDFNMQGGSIDDTDCDAIALDASTVLLTLPTTAADIEVAVLLDGAPAGGGELSLDYEDVQPNGPGCEPICTQADATLTVAPSDPADTCEALEVAFDEAVEEVRGCKEASECGQVLSGFSCGCTRDWVGRLDADPAELYEVAEEATALECEWAGWGSSCDCPETDGFDCIDNICQWNYVSG